MPRPQTAKIVALNITAHPHPAGVYVQLFERAARTKARSKFYGEKAVMLTGMDKEPSLEQAWHGRVHLFTNIDLDKPWLDIAKAEQASHDDIASSVKLPTNFRPGYKSIDFLLLADAHRIFFDSRHVSPSTMQQALRALLKNSRVNRGVHRIEVTVEQNYEELQALFRLEIERFEIVVKRPNPDDLASDEAVIEARMADMQLKELKLTAESEDGRSVVVGPEIKTLANAALSNGYVTVKGKDDNGKKTERSTKDHPLILPIEFSSDHPTLSRALVAASKVWMSIMRRDRKQ